MARPFQQVDVFTRVPYLGNPVAVVLDSQGLSTDQMQRFANWTNLSETTFVLPPTAPGADYQVRIFTPQTELPFAGHPTLGTCHAWQSARARPARGDVVVQQCPAGLIQVRQTDVGLAFAAPPLVRSGPALFSRSKALRPRTLSRAASTPPWLSGSCVPAAPTRPTSPASAPPWAAQAASTSRPTPPAPSGSVAAPSRASKARSSYEPATLSISELS